ncbi:GIY-YIG nuclease family protein [Candidatus Uhrbacteria bacterium]|nr:MAG: GIY-YIG nuclease family protein [Candidatus Uhrbacteria bacterium]
MNTKQYYVYILTNLLDTVLYIGMTNNLPRRINEHREKLVEGFSKKYNLTKLVFYESTDDVNAAIAREKELKGWIRRKKNALIESMNPEWKDLSAVCGIEDPSLRSG